MTIFAPLMPQAAPRPVLAPADVQPPAYAVRAIVCASHMVRTSSLDLYVNQRVDTGYCLDAPQFIGAGATRYWVARGKVH